jgi:hypothetical protein
VTLSDRFQEHEFFNKYLEQIPNAERIVYKTEFKWPRLSDPDK